MRETETNGERGVESQSLFDFPLEPARNVCYCRVRTNHRQRTASVIPDDRKYGARARYISVASGNLVLPACPPLLAIPRAKPIVVARDDRRSISIGPVTFARSTRLDRLNDLRKYSNAGRVRNVLVRIAVSSRRLHVYVYIGCLRAGRCNVFR